MSRWCFPRVKRRLHAGVPSSVKRSIYLSQACFNSIMKGRSFLREYIWTGTVTHLKPMKGVVFSVFWARLKSELAVAWVWNCLAPISKPQVDYVKVCTSSRHSEAQEAFWWHQHEINDSFTRSAGSFLCFC